MINFILALVLAVPTFANYPSLKALRCQPDLSVGPDLKTVNVRVTSTARLWAETKMGVSVRAIVVMIRRPSNQAFLLHHEQRDPRFVTFVDDQVRLEFYWRVAEDVIQIDSIRPYVPGRDERLKRIFEMRRRADPVHSQLTPVQVERGVLAGRAVLIRPGVAERVNAQYGLTADFVGEGLSNCDGLIDDVVNRPVGGERRRWFVADAGDGRRVKYAVALMPNEAVEVAKISPASAEEDRIYRQVLAARARRRGRRR